MPIDFHAKENQTTYAQRAADPGWRREITRFVDLTGKTAVDLGCGGGIYTKELQALGAKKVIGFDFSRSNLAGAKKNCQGIENIHFQMGTAYETGLPDNSCDFLLERALIHHLDDLGQNVCEAFRILRPGSRLLIQDRTMNDILQPPSSQHIRGYFFTLYPRLIEIEAARRPDSDVVCQHLVDGGFTAVAAHSFWEVRRVYPDVAVLVEDIMRRTGRSILYDLTDSELGTLTDAIATAVTTNIEITETDRWTFWTATKP